MAELTKKEKAWDFFIKWHLPLFLIIGLLLGYFFPKPGDKANSADLKGICFKDDTCVYDTIASLCITIMFVLSGAKLKTSEIKDALKNYTAAIFGLVSMLFASPALSLWIITFNFKIPELSYGLALFFTQATTLSSGPIIAAQAKGNVALALLLTVFSNVIAVGTMPLFVVRFTKTYNNLYSLSDSNNNTQNSDILFYNNFRHLQEEESTSVSVDIDASPIILQLVFMIIIPLIFGKLLRYFDFIVDAVNKFSTAMKLFPSFLLAFIVWMKISSSASDLNSLEAVSVILVALVSLALHILLLIFNYLVSVYILKLNEKEMRSVVIVSSQKTLPVALTILELLDENIVGSKGLITVPIIAAHFVQIVTDAFLAAYWSEKALKTLKM